MNMSKLLCKVLIVFCLINVSCKTGVDEKNVDECELFKIGNYMFYNSRVYDHPVIFEKGNHNLLNKEFVPIWYAGYCAENFPAYFNSKEVYLKYISNKSIELQSLAYYEDKYEANKTNLSGINAHYNKDFHLLFRGTVSVKNIKSGDNYLFVAGRSYISKESDYDKNTEFYGKKVKDMFAFKEEEGVYKLINIDRVIGNFSQAQHDKVFEILNPDLVMKSICTETVNTLKKPNFNPTELPSWVYNKSEIVNTKKNEVN